MFNVKVAYQLQAKDLGLNIWVYLPKDDEVISRRLRGLTVAIEKDLVGLVLADEAVGHPDWILGVPAKSLVTLSDEEPMPAWERELLIGDWLFRDNSNNLITLPPYIFNQEFEPVPEEENHG